MKKHNYILEDMAIIVLLILLATGFFFACFNLIANRIDEREHAEQERLDERAGYLLQQEIRMSGIYGINLNQNPEL